MINVVTANVIITFRTSKSVSGQMSRQEVEMMNASQLMTGGVVEGSALS